MRENIDVAKSMAPNGFGDFTPETPVSVASGVRPKKGRFLLVQRKLLAFYAFPQVLTGGGGSGLFDPDSDPVEPPVDPPTFQLFDYAVIRFQWTFDGGDDLDTRTAIIVPEEHYDVGWARGSASLNGALQWGGDNVEDGEESVLIDFLALAALFPTAPIISIRLRAFWFDKRVSGDFNLRFQTYLGGTMSQSDFSYINNGGAGVDFVDAPRNVTMHQSSNLDGETVGYLHYNTATKTANFSANL